MSDERVRLFVALELPAGVRGTLAQWGEEARGAAPGLRAISAQSLHVTLCFLGSRAASELDAIAAAAHAVFAEPAPSLSVNQGLWLPRRRPRVLALELDDPNRTLTATQALLSEALRSGGWYEPDERSFLPHVTVARVPRGVRVGRTELPAAPELSFEGSTVTLFRSRLSAGGARYEPLTRVPLRDPGG